MNGATVRAWLAPNRAARCSSPPTSRSGRCVHAFCQAAAPFYHRMRSSNCIIRTRPMPPSGNRRPGPPRSFPSRARKDLPPPDATTGEPAGRPRRDCRRRSCALCVVGPRLAGLLAHQKLYVRHAGETLTAGKRQPRPPVIPCPCAVGGSPVADIQADGRN